MRCVQVSAAPACAPVAPRRVTRDTAAPPPAAPARAGGVRAAKEAGTRKGGKGGSGKAEKRKAVRSTSKVRLQPLEVTHARVCHHPHTVASDPFIFLARSIRSSI